MRDGFARPEYSFEAHELCPRGAMAEHLKPAGVRSNGPTHRRAVTAAEIDAVRPARSDCGSLDVGHRRPGRDGDLAAQWVDVGDARQPAQTEYDLAGKGDASSDEAGVAPLGHECDSGLFAHGDHRCYLSGVPGADDGPGMTLKAPGPVDGVRRHHLRLYDDVHGSNDLAELVQEARGHTSILAPVSMGVDPDDVVLVTERGDRGI